MVSLTDVTNWLGNRKDDVVNDVDRAYSASSEAVTTGSANNLTMTRRDFGKGVVGATLLGAYGDDAAGAVGDTAGAAWHEVDKRLPDYRIDIEKVGGGNGTDNGSTPTPGDEGTPTPTPDDNSTPTPTPDEEGTPTPTPTPTPELTYDSISEGLLEQSDHTRSGFRGYSLTALENQLEGVGLEEAVENSSDYRASIRDALEGTNYDDGVFELGDYGRGVDLGDDIEASEEFDQYMENLDERGELEDEMFGYVESLERV